MAELTSASGSAHLSGDVYRSIGKAVNTSSAQCFIKII